MPYSELIFAFLIKKKGRHTVFKGPLSEAYTQPYSFGGRIKLIIFRIRPELNITIHEISTS